MATSVGRAGRGLSGKQFSVRRADIEVPVGLARWDVWCAVDHMSTAFC